MDNLIKNPNSELVTLGISYYDNDEPYEAYEILYPLAILDDAIAQYYIGLIFCTEEFEQDYDSAAIWLNKSRLNNYSDASYSLGMLNLHELIESHSLSSAEGFFDEAYRLSGNCDGYFELGKSYISNNDVQLKKKALHYFTTAAENNHPQSINALGILHLEGKVVNKDIELAKSFFERSSQLGYLRANINLAKIIQETSNNQNLIVETLLPTIISQEEITGWQLHPETYYQAFDEFLIPLAVKGNALALNYLGEREVSSAFGKLKMHFPIETPPTLTLAKIFDLKKHYCCDLYYKYEQIINFIKSLGPNNELDFDNLSESEIFAIQNDFVFDFFPAIKKAKDYFEQSAAHDCPFGEFNLGLFYLNGISVKQDISFAKSLFEKSASKDHLGALSELIFMKLVDINTDDSERVKLMNDLKITAHYGHPKACRLIGISDGPSK
jgi:TPR repeat protein